MEGLEIDPWNLLMNDYDKNGLRKGDFLSGLGKLWIATWENKLLSVPHILSEDELQMYQI